MTRLFWAIPAVMSAVHLSEPPVFLNLTSSVPRGIYLRLSRPPQKDDFVALCPPQSEVLQAGLERGYLIRNQGCSWGAAPLLKVLAAASGDHVTWSSEGVAVNGKLWPLSAPLSEDPSGRPLPKLRQERRLDPQEVVVLSRSATAFDARYFGALVPQTITAVRPVFTWQ